LRRWPGPGGPAKSLSVTDNRAETRNTNEKKERNSSCWRDWIAERRRLQDGLLSPVLIEARTELAAAEDLPVATLIALLLNEALGHRLHRSRS